MRVKPAGTPGSVHQLGELVGRPSISPVRRRPGLASYPRVSAGAGHTLFGLAPGEVCLAGPSPGSLVRSYRTVSPLPPAVAGGGLSLLHWLAPFGGLPLATTLLRGARTFLGTRGWRGRLAGFLACRRVESNHRHPPYQGGALTI